MGARTGVTSNFGPGSLGGLPTTEKTIGSLARSAGYATAAIGKVCAHAPPPRCMVLLPREKSKPPSAPFSRHSFGRTAQWHLGVKPGFHPLDHGYDHYLGLPESNDYGCTDTTMGAPDSGCLNWRADRCPRNSQEENSAWDGSTCHPGPKNPWKYSLPLLHN
eukprot:SAG11_NODE_7439_length_1143_cov_1.634100_1_plen_161_part_10